jgi:hypothetical protein
LFFFFKILIFEWFTESVTSDAKSAFGSQGSGDFSFDFGWGLSNETGLIEKTVLGGIFFGSDSFKEGFFSSEDLNCGGWEFGKVYKRAGVGNESGSDKFTNHLGKVGGYGLHSIFEIF